MSNSSKPHTADQEIGDFLAELDAEFGKKVKAKSSPGARELNRQFHAANPSIPHAQGRSPERLNVEDSSHWKPVARVTYVVRQGCKCCGNWVDFIGGEFVRFKSVMPYGGEVLRRIENCPNVWHFEGETLPDLIEWHSQDVLRCPGCIQVEQAAVEIWESVQKAQVQPALPGVDQDEIVIDLGE